ncbi:hypothetical protein BACCIP111895_04762 [Neobacillus rhizosphaerae]|uniref:Uncharacterized protein n=1 Tax=Neobacillus rhizosphaerae TaxID=2880965 RepID=A0ABN8KYW7_9BACI|nr:hypothetical protein [Neobacillus rhizosphaerae]CAH2717548.1 hypothetical protein BACCIP111895_04762 [Neobacillus rhizosphaerae]
MSQSEQDKNQKQNRVQGLRYLKKKKTRPSLLKYRTRWNKEKLNFIISVPLIVAHNPINDVIIRPNISIILSVIGKGFYSCCSKRLFYNVASLFYYNYYIE